MISIIEKLEEKIKEIDKYIKNKEKLINNLSAKAKLLKKQSNKTKDNSIKLSLLKQACRKWKKIDFFEKEIDDVFNLQQKLKKQLKKIKQGLTSDDIESKLEHQANDEIFIKAQQLIEQVNSLLFLENQLVPNLIIKTKQYIPQNNITSQSQSNSMLVDQEVPCWENESLNLVDVINQEEHQQTSTSGYKPNSPKM